tara:strand:- start:21513 stop:22343 length:831 start_codon:yes stop_codon:yes gene_type:complete
MKIFLTGGSGFVGRKFIKEALKAGHVIYAITRKNKKKKKNLIWLKGDLDKDWSRYLKKSKVLVHMAAAGVNKHIDLEESINANVLKPHKLLINAINSKCFNWIIIGSASEYGKQAKLKKPLNNKTKELPETNYEVTKNLFTKLSIFLSRKYKINCRIMRLFNVYGEGEKKRRLWQSLKTAAKLNKDFKMSDGKEIRDFISVNEVAKVILNAMNFKIQNKSFPQIWHVASGKPVSVKSFATKNWKKYKAKGRILFGKIKIKSKKNYISDKKSIWNIK